jgi:hypothetical protein
MLGLQQAKVVLRKLFRRVPAVKLDALCRVLKTRSRTSVFRRLKAVGYFSSFTHRGRYYTLREVPQFDSLGLWHCRDAGFSQAGSLKATVRELVRSSPAGRTHRELQGLLGVRAHNELLDLTRAQLLRRETLAARGALYVSADKALASEQFARRLEGGATEGKAHSNLVIEALLELLDAATVDATPAQVAQRLSARGVGATATQVRQVFERYKLGRKKGVRLPRSRR